MFFNSAKKILIIGVIAISIGGALYTVNKTAPTLFEKTVGTVITPIQKFTIGSKDWFSGIADYFKGVSELQRENSSLKDELLLARAEANMLHNIENENKKLYSLIGTAEQYSGAELKGAKVISRSPGNWNNMFIIDKGSLDGIERNMPVLAADGLVGKVYKCGPHYSQVVSIINNSDTVTAKSSRTDDVGYVTGSTASDDICVIRFVDETADFMAGDEVITSNLSDIYPEGIPIGKITEIMANEDGTGDSAYLQPAVDLQHLENVIVLCRNYKKQYDSIVSDSAAEVTSEQTTISTADIPDYAYEPASAPKQNN